MSNKLLVITEIKHPADAKRGNGYHSNTPKFWHQLPQNKIQKDQNIRTAWYNIDLDTWDPGILDVPPTNGGILIGTDTYQMAFKIPSPKPIVMFDYDHPEYLKRLEYCREVNITITIEEIPVDGHWTP